MVSSDAEETPVSSETPVAEKPAHARRSAGFWIGVLVAFVFVVACAIPVAMTATPSQCATCHEMRPYYESWKSSSHREAAANCLVCHVRPGVLNWVAYEAGFYGELAAHFQGAQVTSTAANTPAVESCVRSGCHSVNRETSNAGDIKIDHRLHVIEARIPCTRCHPGAVHAGVNGRLKLPPMKLCKDCHADKMQQCSYCHSAEVLQGVPAGVH
jgi:hypothetical protein